MTEARCGVIVPGFTPVCTGFDPEYKNCVEFATVVWTDGSTGGATRGALPSTIATVPTRRPSVRPMAFEIDTWSDLSASGVAFGLILKEIVFERWRARYLSVPDVFPVKSAPRAAVPPETTHCTVAAVGVAAESVIGT